MARFTRVGNLSNLAKGCAMVFRLAENEEVVVTKAGEKIYAFQRHCPHADYPLESSLEWIPIEFCRSSEHSILTCYVHSNKFDLETGESLGPMTTERIKIYSVKVYNDGIYIQLHE